MVILSSRISTRQLSMQTISLKVPSALSQRLAQFAEDQQRSKSDVIGDAIEIYLRSERSGKTESALDGIEDLIGCVEGPGDLSTNKAYFDDFGR